MCASFLPHDQLRRSIDVYEDVIMKAYLAVKDSLHPDVVDNMDNMDNIDNI